MITPQPHPLVGSEHRDDDAAEASLRPQAMAVVTAREDADTARLKRIGLKELSR